MNMNNWHRKIWTLQKSDDTVFYRSGASNQFWLEPLAYAGPEVTVPASSGALNITLATTYSQNTLCFRVDFLEDAMTEAWRGLVLFATGTGLFENETATDSTQRIENLVQVSIPPPPTVLQVVVRAFLTSGQHPKLYLNTEYQGGGNGWVHTT